MFKPDEIVKKAKNRDTQNQRFRTQLKGHADPEELDARFKALHEKLFADYDCTQCGNFCRMYRTTVQTYEMERIAERLGITVFELKAIPHKRAARLAVPFPSSASCIFLDLP